MCSPTDKVRLPLIKEYLLKNYKATFEGLGSLGRPVVLQLDPNVAPVHAPVHCVPIAKKDAVKKKLDEMVAENKLVKTEEPTDWCSNMSVVERVKPDGSLKIRLCIDPSQTINKAILIPKHTVPTLEELLPRSSVKKYNCLLSWMFLMDLLKFN